MYPKYRIVEMTNGDYCVQWRPLFMCWFKKLSANYKTLEEAKAYLKWTMADDERCRQRRMEAKIKVKRIVEEKE